MRRIVRCVVFCRSVAFWYVVHDHDFTAHRGPNRLHDLCRAHRMALEYHHGGDCVARGSILSHVFSVSRRLLACHSLRHYVRREHVLRDDDPAMLQLLASKVKRDARVIETIYDRDLQVAIVAQYERCASTGS